MSASLFLSCSFSRRSASRRISVLGPDDRPARLALRRVLNSTRSSAKTDVEALLPPVPLAPFVPFWAAASLKAEISRFSLLTWASDSASSTFSRSIFSSRSWGERATMVSFDMSEWCQAEWIIMMHTCSSLRERTFMIFSSSAS